MPDGGPRAAKAIVSAVGATSPRTRTQRVGPGNNESAGKRLSGKTNKGGTYLKNALI